MAAYSLDFWNRVIPLLTIWKDLTLRQRKSAVKLETRYERLGKEWADLPADTLNQLFETSTKGLHRPLLDFQKLIGLQKRLDLWSRLRTIETTTYIHEYTTHVQRHALSGVRPGVSPETHVAALVRKIIDGGFTKMLLESDSHKDFLVAVSHWEPEAKSLDERHYLALKAWLAKVTAKGSAGCLLHNQTFFPYDGGIPPGELTYLALSYGLAVVTNAPDTLEVYLQVAGVTKVLVQSADKCVTRILNATSTFTRPFLLEDMEVYLRSLKTNAALPLSDGRGVALAHHRKVAKRFLPLPYLLPHANFESEDRAMAAWWMISALKLATPQGDRWAPELFRLNSVGENWLLLSKEKKLEAILTKVPCGRRKSRILNEDDLYSWLGDFQNNPIPYHALTERVFSWMDVVMAHLEEPTETFEWLKKVSTHSNPFLADSDNSPELQGYWARWHTNPKTSYTNLLTRYLARLISLGAIAISHDDQSNVGVSLTSVGKWLFGLSQTWTLAEEIRPIALVGADFSLTLLESAPSIALDVSDFTETVMAGTSYRITRASVQNAIHRGRKAEEILTTLRACSKKEIPANVAHEIEAWSASKQSVHLSEAILVEGQDPIAMAEIMSRFPNDFARISPTLLKFIGKGKLSDLGKKLIKKGFFID